MINFNGTVINRSEKVLSSSNRAFKYGDALFETIKVENLHINFLEDHYFRLMASMRMLRMDISMNFTLEFFENEIISTVKSNNLKNARVRFSVFRKDGGFYQPITNQIEYLIEVSTLNIGVKEIYKIDLFKDYYINSGILSTIKTTSKITNVLASIYANENNYDNCILLNENKQVVEAINGNIFIIKDNLIKTPKVTEGCVKGIARKQIIEIINKKNNLKLEETIISPFELQKADEVFITNVIIGVQPVTGYKKSSYETKISKELALAFQNLV